MKELFMVIQDMNGNITVKEKCLVYVHLPTAEYILKALSLYHRGRTSKSALNDFFRLLRAEYQKISNLILEEHPDIVIFSPLQKLVDSLIIYDQINKQTQNFLNDLMVIDEDNGVQKIIEIATNQPTK